MLCECCQQHEATIHLTQMVNGQSRELHLCEDCAEESGMNVQNVMSIPEMLFGLGAGDTSAGGEAPVGKTCPHCHLRGCDFKKTGRLGCARCYETFEADLAPMLAAMHKGTRHTGKIPVDHQRALERGVVRDDLKAKLATAVRGEQYEEAARLRDLLREAEHDAE